MRTIAAHVSAEIAAHWQQLARDLSIPVETWLALCGFWGAALSLPITRIILRQPPAQRVLEGVAWEVGEFPFLTCPKHSEGDHPMVQTGETKYSTEVVCETFKMLGKRTAESTPPPAASDAPADSIGPEDDVAF